jgi:hypothetical protein
MRQNRFDSAKFPLMADFVEEVGVGTDRAALVLVC